MRSGTMEWLRAEIAYVNALPAAGCERQTGSLMRMNVLLVSYSRRRGGSGAGADQRRERDSSTARANAFEIATGGTAGSIPSSRRRWSSVLIDIANAQGGMERLKNTPLPNQYRLPAHDLHARSSACCCRSALQSRDCWSSRHPTSGSTMAGFDMFLATLTSRRRSSPTPFALTVCMTCRSPPCAANGGDRPAARRSATNAPAPEADRIGRVSLNRDRAASALATLVQKRT